MDDLTGPIRRATAKAQAGLVPRVNYFYRRGGRLSLIDAVSGDSVTWRYDTGEIETGTLEEWRSQTIEPVDTSGNRALDADYLGHVWTMAVGSNVPHDIRADVVRDALRRAPTPQEAEVVRGWLGALVRGVEPRRPRGVH